jgi:hypothetical protein
MESPGSYARYLKKRKISRRRSKVIRQLEIDFKRISSKRIWYFEHHPRDAWRNCDYEMVKFAVRIISYVDNIKEKRKGKYWVDGVLKDEFRNESKKIYDLWMMKIDLQNRTSDLSIQQQDENIKMILSEYVEPLLIEKANPVIEKIIYTENPEDLACDFIPIKITFVDTGRIEKLLKLLACKKDVSIIKENLVDDEFPFKATFVNEAAKKLGWLKELIMKSKERISKDATFEESDNQKLDIILEK